jgi:hypothetical protein
MRTAMKMRSRTSTTRTRNQMVMAATKSATNVALVMRAG